MHALEQVGILSEVMKDALPMKGRQMHNSDGIQTFHRYGKDDSGVNYSVSRAGLNMALMNAAEKTGEVTIHFNRKCTGMDFESRIVHFVQSDSGEKESIPAETVIGSDVSATALAACCVAFFPRSNRAASQGGIEIGFHSHEALLLAAQTALGADSLVHDSEEHPESEIDKLTTPRGCTIAGINEMEHRGFSSAMIKGILASAEMADKLYITGSNT